jgi:hypothetical protein
MRNTHQKSEDHGEKKKILDLSLSLSFSFFFSFSLSPIGEKSLLLEAAAVTSIAAEKGRPDPIQKCNVYNFLFTQFVSILRLLYNANCI